MIQTTTRKLTDYVHTACCRECHLFTVEENLCTEDHCSSGEKRMLPKSIPSHLTFCHETGSILGEKEGNSKNKIWVKFQTSYSPTLSFFHITSSRQPSLILSSVIMTKAWFLNHCYIAFYVPSVMWTISLSMVFIIFSYSEDLWSPCFLKTQVLNSGLHWPLCFSAHGDWGGEKERGFPVTCLIHPYFEFFTHSVQPLGLISLLSLI